MWDASIEDTSHNMNEVHGEGEVQTLLRSLNLQMSKASMVNNVVIESSECACKGIQYSQ